MKKLNLTTAILIISAIVAFAQTEFNDQLVKRDGKIVKCKIIEIGDDEIKYNEEGLRNDIIIGIDKAKVDKIIFADGREYKIDNAMGVYEDLSTQRKNGLKFNLLSPITGGYALTYERSLKPARSIEAEIGLIAQSENNEMDSPEAHGLFIKTGYKMMRSPDYYMRGMKYAHILKGSYVKPEIAFTSFSYDKTKYIDDDPKSGTETKVAILVNVGKQIVYSNAFVIDFFVGAGYAFGDMDLELDYYAFLVTSEVNSFVVTGGLKVGFLFGEKKK